MNRFKHIAICFLAALLTLGLSAETHAQTAARARPTGGAQGLDLQIEGALQATRGGELRWLVTTYEVVGMSTLRLAPNTEVQLTTALDPTAEPLTVTSDARGRALIVLPIPADAPDSFGVVLRALRSAAGGTGVQRRFEFTVTTSAARSLFVGALRQVATAGGLLHASVMARDASARPLASLPVRLELRDASGRAIMPRVEVRTNAGGVAHHVFQLPRDAQGEVRIVATSGERRERLESTQSAYISVAQPSSQLRVAVAPSRTTLEPGETIDVDVVVRNEEGRPIEGALIQTQDGRSYEEQQRAPYRTDARGRLRFRFHAPEVAGAFGDAGIYVQAAHEFEGSGTGTAQLRIARAERAATFSVEGGALIPTLGGRVFARVVMIDGSPAPQGVGVEFIGPRIGRVRGTTDASGIAVLDVAALSNLAPGTQDRCGGDAATAVELHVAGGDTLESCLALDPDGAARIRVSSPLLARGATAQLEVVRAPIAAQLPISIRAVHPTTRRLFGAVVLAPGETTASITLPAEIIDRVLFIARPLFGPEGREVRGGTAQAWVQAGQPAALQVSIAAQPEGMRVDIAAQPGVTALVVAAPLEELEGMMSHSAGPDLGASLRQSLAIASPDLVRAALAVTTTRDIAAPFALRQAGNTTSTIALPAPTDPLEFSLLRDPWRAQSRFLTGRLALLFRAIEERVASAVPERIEDVAVQTNGRWDFNAQIVASVADGGAVGGEGATGLGGEPITVEALRAFDPAFTYDNVARRITRERLFRLLVALRRFVLSNGYDIPWARLGDPSTWLAHTTELYDEAIGQLSTRELVDGWGRPFVLAPVRGQSRYAAWQPLAGWEVFSVGPDGRGATGDDLTDPTARVLPSASPYAQSVGEDALLARLTGVELGRATVTELGQRSGAGYVGIPASTEAASAGVALELWERLPSLMTPVIDPLGLRRPTHLTNGASALRALDGRPILLTLDEEPRVWGVVAMGFDADGMIFMGQAHALLGSPLIVEGSLPERVRVDEAIEAELRVTNTSTRDLSLAIDAQGTGAVSLATGNTSISLPAETSSLFRIRITGREPGQGNALVRFVDAGNALRSMRAITQVDRGLIPIRTRSALIRTGPIEMHLDAPSDGRDATSRVVVLRPDALGLDPDLADTRMSDPGLVAWSLSMAGRPLDEALRTSLQHDHPSAMPRLSAACALVAWSTADNEDEVAQQAAQRVRNTLGQYGSGDAAESAAVLAALSPGGAYELADTMERQLDPVAQLVARERAQLRRVLRRTPEDTSILARAAAALLLADAGDAHGRAMVERVRAHLERIERGNSHGQRVIPTAARESLRERLTATLAFAVAVRQLGEFDLAQDLVRGAAFDDNLIVASGGELLFWWLAAGAYGAMQGAPSDAALGDSLTLQANGRAFTGTLSEGRAVIPLDRGLASSNVHLAGEGPLFVRLESLSYTPYSERTDAPLTLAIQGENGDARHTASLELTVHATSEVASPVLLIQLPAGITPDEALLSAIRGSGVVVMVEPRTPGLLRVRLAAMASGTDIRIPLPLRWSVRGTMRGLGVVAYEANSPGRTTVLAPRTITID